MGKPIHNAIVWQAHRKAVYCDQLKPAGYEVTFQRLARVFSTQITAPSGNSPKPSSVILVRFERLT